MATISLATFINEHRDELIRLCRQNVAARSAPPATNDEIDHGVPMFLSQLSNELDRPVPNTNAISGRARTHGAELLKRGFTIDQVVHCYGDVCQSVTGLAVKTDTPIRTEDFRTLNRCLDDAIAGAVSEFAKEQDRTRDGEASELWYLVNAAGTAFESLQSGRVGVSGATADLVRRSLARLRAYVDRRDVDATRAAAARLDAALPERRTTV